MDDPDLREEIERLETEIDELAGVIDRSHKLGAIAKTAIAAGVVVLLASMIGLMQLHPIGFICAMAAVIGGIVLFGSNASTLKQAAASIKGAEARRAELIGRIDLRPVGDSRDGSLQSRRPDNAP